MDKKELKAGQKIETKEGVFEIIRVDKIYSLDKKEFEEAVIINNNGTPTKIKFEQVTKIVGDKKEGK